MERRSRFVYGGQTFTTSVSVRPWIPVDNTIGGYRIAGSGVPAGYVARRDSIVELVVRFYESEWLSLLNMIIYAQDGAASITWYPDDDDEDTSFVVYLDSPAAGERIVPTRDSQFPRLLELPLVLRGSGTEVPFVPYLELY